jgi:hypothetical protein
MDKPRELQPTERVAVELEAQQWNQMLELLEIVRAPRRVTSPLVQAIVTQCMRHLSAEVHTLHPAHKSDEEAS